METLANCKAFAVFTSYEVHYCQNSAQRISTIIILTVQDYISLLLKKKKTSSLNLKLPIFTPDNLRLSDAILKREIFSLETPKLCVKLNLSGNVFGQILFSINLDFMFSF